jgi:hypothetical protein
MSKNIEDFVVDLSKTDIGVQVVVELERVPPLYEGVISPYYITENNPDYPRFKAISAQIQRALGIRGHLDSIMICAADKFGCKQQLQLSYKAAHKENRYEAGRVQNRNTSKNKSKSKRKKSKK